MSNGGEAGGRGGLLGAAQLIAAVAAGVAAWFVAPAVHDDWHKEFVDFFAASATVIAALLVAFAIEARQVVRSMFVAIVTALSLAVGVVSALGALSPDLPACMYRWLFVFTAAGGVGGLVAVVVIGAQTLAMEIDEERLGKLEQMLERSRTDEKRRQTEHGGTVSVALPESGQTQQQVEQSSPDQSPSAESRKPPIPPTQIPKSP